MSESEREGRTCVPWKPWTCHELGVQSPCVEQVVSRTDWIPLSPHWVNQFSLRSGVSLARASPCKTTTPAGWAKPQTHHHSRISWDDAAAFSWQMLRVRILYYETPGSGSGGCEVTELLLYEDRSWIMWHVRVMLDLVPTSINNTERLSYNGTLHRGIIGNFPGKCANSFR